MSNRMKWLYKLEEKTGMSGYAIAKYLGMTSQQYYKTRDEADKMHFKHLSKIYKLPGVTAKQVAEWIQEEFK